MKLCTFSPPNDGATFSVRIDPARREHVVLAGDAAPVPAVNAAGLTGGVPADISRSAAGGGAPADAAETVRLLAELDRMHVSGALGDAEFDALKRKLLGED